MRYAGIDIGSRTIELVVVDETGRILGSLQSNTGFDPMAEAKEMTQDLAFDRIMATGYGRNLFEISFDAPTVTEIKAHAVGARFCFPEAEIVLDIGGQDSKAISILGNGKVKKFEMNDRCAPLGYLSVAQVVFTKKYGFTGLELDTGGGLVHKDNIGMVAPLAKKGIR